MIVRRPYRSSSLSSLIFLKCFWAYFWRFL